MPGKKQVPERQDRDVHQDVPLMSSDAGSTGNLEDTVQVVQDPDEGQ